MHFKVGDVIFPEEIRARLKTDSRSCVKYVCERLSTGDLGMLYKAKMQSEDDKSRDGWIRELGSIPLSFKNKKGEQVSGTEHILVAFEIKSKVTMGELNEL